MAATTTRTILLSTYRFNTGSEVIWEQEPRRELPADIAAGSPEQWLWCFDCERAFQVRDAQRHGDEATCAYLDCAGLPDAFWKWESFRSFSGANVAPTLNQVFPLAAAA